MTTANPGEARQEFGALIRELRQQRGLPLRALGHPTTIHNYEIGRQAPRNRQTVLDIADALKIDPGLLFDALGWPHRPISQRVQAVRALIVTDAAQAARAAQAGLDRAVEAGLVDEVYQWQLVLADARKALGSRPLPVDFRGRGDLDEWRIQATDLIQQDSWFGAAKLLTSLLAYMPRSHPSYGKTVYNLAVALAALGHYEQAETQVRHGWLWAQEHQEGWLAIIMCEAIARFAVKGGRGLPADALDALLGYQGPPETRRFVACWIDDILTHAAAHRGDWITADQHACALRHRVVQHDDLGSEALRVALATAVVLAGQERYAVALATLDPALIGAMANRTPGYLLLDALLFATECAVRGKDFTAPSRIAWLQGWLGGLQALPQLARLGERLGMPDIATPAPQTCPPHYRAYWAVGLG